MFNLVASSTTALLGAALDVTSLRQQAIAQNIANANTPGYRRVMVDFDAQVDGLRRQAGGAQRTAGTPARPHIVPVADPAQANDVSLDLEVADLSDTVLRHQALLKVVSREYAIIGTAITEGKR